MKRGHTAKSQPRSINRWIPVHGLSQTVEGRAWAAIMSRCFNKKCKAYQLYGAKGITACEFVKASPKNLIALIGMRPSPELSVDRFPDNKGNYSCGSCPECATNRWRLNIRWATVKQQCNNKTDNCLLTINRKTQTVTQWAEETGIPKGVIFRRIKLGWGNDRLLLPVEKAVLVTINGETKKIKEWAKAIGIHVNAFRKRLDRGVPQHLLTLPRQKPRAFVNAK